MATFEQIKGIRLKVDDPQGLIDIVEVSALPSAFDPQVGYLFEGKYYTADSPATPVELYVSDPQISSWIDSNGETHAEYLVIERIIMKLGRSMLLVKTNAGAEDTEYTSLKSLLNYYEAALSRIKQEEEKADKVNTGRMIRTKKPEIAGGLL